MDTDPRPMSPAQVFREWQRSRATGEQEGTAKVVDIDGYTEICLASVPRR